MNDMHESDTQNFFSMNQPNAAIERSTLNYMVIFLLIQNNQNNSNIEGADPLFTTETKLRMYEDAFEKNELDNTESLNRKYKIATDGLKRELDKEKIEAAAAVTADLLTVTTSVIKQPKVKTTKPKPSTFADLFINPEHALPCLDIFKKLDPPFVSYDNRWIGKAKGVFKFWIDILVSARAGSIINPAFTNTDIAEMLMTKIIGLKLTSSEIGKTYPSLDETKLQKEIRSFLSVLSVK